MTTITTIDKEIAEAEAKLTKLKLEKKVYDGLKPEQRLADMIHYEQCHLNHNDACGWYYESWDKPGFSRDQYLKKAKEILSEVPFAQVVKLIRYLQS